MSVVLSGETEERISILLESGKFQTAEQVVNEGLRLLALKEFQSRLDESLAQVDRGDFIEGDDFEAKLFAEMEEEERAEQSTRK
jgi:Arc/MetJ-type ribon-helix-helix transcriptional regulator